MQKVSRREVQLVKKGVQKVGRRGVESRSGGAKSKARGLMGPKTSPALGAPCTLLLARA